MWNRAFGLQQFLWYLACSLRTAAICFFLPFLWIEWVSYWISSFCNKISCPGCVWERLRPFHLLDITSRALSMNPISSSQAFIFLTNCKQYNNNKIGNKFDKSVGKNQLLFVWLKSVHDSDIDVVCLCFLEHSSYTWWRSISIWGF